MATVLLPCGIVLLLALLWAELPLLDRWMGGTRGAARRPRYVLRGNHVHGETAHRPIELVAADLRRLSRQLALVPAGAPLVRWRALWSAYDAVLAEACQVLEVPHSLAEAPVGIARDIERLRVESALEGAGLVVRG